MNSNNENKTAPLNEIIIDGTTEANDITNITIKVYLYGKESPADTYRFDT